MFIDAYAHVGWPRFGTARQAAGFLSAQGLERMALVLFPGCPDLAAIDQAHAELGERVRVFGMPYGRDEKEVIDLVSAQIDAGVSGFRMDPRELAAFPGVLERIGRAGRVVYATNPARHPETCSLLFEWLDRFPGGLVAAPHFLNLEVPLKASPARQALDRLTGHARFAAILSRHGGMGSNRPYPHDDFLAWLDYLVETCGWQRLLWGSEYPVFFWRNERLGECRDWLAALRPGDFEGPAGRGRLEGFLGGNAQRLIFGRPRPARSALRRPAWMQGRFDPRGPVTIFPRGIELPMTVYQKHLDAYLERLTSEPKLTFNAYMAEALEAGKT